MPQEYVKGIFQEYAKGIFQEYAKGRKTTHPLENFSYIGTYPLLTSLIASL